MGVTHVTVTIRNPALPDKSWEGLFLVDTVAIDSLVPREHLESIGLKPKAQRIYELADGSQLKMDITTADIEFMGDLVGVLSSLGRWALNQFLVSLRLNLSGLRWTHRISVSKECRLLALNGYQLKAGHFLPFWLCSNWNVSTSWGKHRSVPLGTFENSPTIYCRDELNTNPKVL